jgi:DNA-binding response OmpR family regulator
MPAKRVLIVDDALELGHLIQAALGTLDSNLLFTVVPSAEEAQLEAARYPIDLVVTDVRLPGVSGLELTRRIRARHKNAKIILITGVNDPTIRKQSLEAGADFFFKKPLSMPEFLGAVQEILKTPSKPKPYPKLVTGSLEQPQTDRIAEALSASRHALAAYSVALLDDHGHVLAQDGNYTEIDFHPSLLPALMETMNKGEKVSQHLGTKIPEAAYLFKGQSFELIISPLGGSFAILVMLRSGRSSVKLSIAVDEVFQARKEFERILADMGVALHPQTLRPFEEVNPPEKKRITTLPETPEKINPQANQGTMLLKPLGSAKKPSLPPLNPAPVPTPTVQAEVQEVPKKEAPKKETPKEEPPKLPDLEAIFGSAENSKLNPAEVENFWDKASNDEASNRLAMPDKLSYDQARQMGLAPETPDPSSNL